MIKFINQNTEELFSSLKKEVFFGIEIEFYSSKDYIIFHNNQHNILLQHKLFKIEKEKHKNQYEIIFYKTNDIKIIALWEGVINDIIQANKHCVFNSFYKEISNGLHINISITQYKKKDIFNLCENLCQFFFHNKYLLLQNNDRLLHNDTFTPQYISWGPNNRFSGIRIKKDIIEVRFFTLYSPIDHIINIILLNIMRHHIGNNDKYIYGPQYGTKYDISIKN